MSHGVEAVVSEGANSRTKVEEVPAQPLAPVGVPIPATEKSEARRVAQRTGSVIVTRSPSI